MTDGKKDQLKRKKTLEYELRRLYRAGELTDQQIAELKEAEFPFDAPVRRTAKSVVRIDDGKRWPSCSAAEKELGITQGWMSDVCNMAQNGKWVAIKNQFYCFESMYSPDMDLTEIRGLAGWIVNLETGEMFPTTTEAAKAAGTSRSVVLDHVKNKVKPQNKRFSYVRDWDGKVGRLVDLNVQMICLETDTIYHSYDEICAAIWSDGYGETRKEIVQKVGDAIRHGCPAFDMHWANGENLEERKEAYMEEKRLCARPVIELTTMREYADVHDALKFGSRYVDWKKIVAICDAKGEPTSEATRWRGERWFWKDDWKKNIKLKSGERIKDMQPVICYERGRCDYSVLELTRWYGFDHKSLLNSGKKGKIDTTDEVTVYDLLTSFDYTAKDGIKHFDGGDIIPGDVLVSNAESDMAKLDTRLTMLADAMEGIDDDYDYAIIDCPPSLGLVTRNAMVAADELIVPVIPNRSSLKGFTNIQKCVNSVRRNKRLNPNLRIAGIVVNMFDGRTSLSRGVVNELPSIARAANTKMFHTIIAFSSSTTRNQRIRARAADFELRRM